MYNYSKSKPRGTDPKAVFSVSMNVSLLKAIEKYMTKSQSSSRSEFLQKAAIYYIRNWAEEWQKEKDDIKRLIG